MSCKTSSGMRPRTSRNRIINLGGNLNPEGKRKVQATEMAHAIGCAYFLYSPSNRLGAFLYAVGDKEKEKQCLCYSLALRVEGCWEGASGCRGLQLAVLCSCPDRRPHLRSSLPACVGTVGSWECQGVISIFDYPGVVSSSQWHASARAPCPRADPAFESPPSFQHKPKSCDFLIREFSHTLQRSSVFDYQRLFCHSVGYHPTEAPAEITVHFAVRSLSWC